MYSIFQSGNRCIEFGLFISAGERGGSVIVGRRTINVLLHPTIISLCVRILVEQRVSSGYCDVFGFYTIIKYVPAGKRRQYESGN